MSQLPIFMMLADAPSSELESRTPELPNLISVLYHRFHDMPWAKFLYKWENLFFSILIALIISIIAHIGSRKKSLIPSGLQNGLEFAVEHFRKLVLGVLGPQGETYIPFLGTLFIYILSMNLFGLIPLMKSPSSSINITAALAICVFCLVQFLNIRNMGVFGFMYHMAGSPQNVIGWMLAPFMLILELITQLARPVTLALRLFGNVLGEDILIGAFALLGVVLVSSLNSPIGLPLQIPFMFLAILTSLMQALVFTLLSTVYILLSIPHGEKH